MTAHRLNMALAVVLLAALGVAVAGDSPWRREDRNEVISITTPSGAVDRCPTCHRSALGESQKGKPHPTISGHEDLTTIGCTSCHGGQGRRLDTEAHSPTLGSGPRPFLKGDQLQARCARCHPPTNLEGAPVLHRGFEEYLGAACTGCHHPGRKEEGLGPDLRRMGRRTEAELRDALIRPRESHGGATMWSLGWRYKKGKQPGPEALRAVVVALLAMGERAEPHREAWARPTLRVDVDCATCHLEVRGGQTMGKKHRCTLLRPRPSKSGDNPLRCARCHGETGTRVKSHGIECPHIRAARPLCPVCHTRSGFDGA